VIGICSGRDADRRVVIVVRQRGGRVLPFVRKTEAEGDAIVRERVALGAVIHADEAGHWDVPEARYAAHRINHSQAYGFDGASTDQAESHFSRLRRTVLASITTFRRTICISMRAKPRGARIIAARTIASCSGWSPPLALMLRLVASGRATGSARKQRNPKILGGCARGSGATA
jgi:hypothetical protein